jgi:tetratricopeptide (TPR) repeat protein
MLMLFCFTCLFNLESQALASGASDASFQTKDDFSPVQSQHDFLFSHQSENSWQSHECDRLRSAGDLSLKEKKYEQALVYYEQSLSEGFNESAAVGKADCLGHLDRLDEAIELLQKLTMNSYEDKTWAILIDDLIKLKRFDRAYASCDVWQDIYLRGGNSFLLRGKVALAQGNIGMAQKYLLDGYFHCKRYSTEVFDIIEKLSMIGITPPDKVPEITRGNGDVYAMIDALIKIENPLNERELAYVFKKSFTVDGYPNGQSSVHNLSYVDGNAPIERIDVNVGAKAPIKSEVNLDLCTIRSEDIKSKYKYILAPEDTSGWLSREVDPSGGSHLLAIKCENGFVVCDFGRTNSGELEAVIRLFTNSREEKKLLGNSALREHMMSVQILLDKKDYRKAATELIDHWTDSYPDAHTITSSHQMLLKKRDLLIAAYQDRPEIQAYLKNACLLFITQDIDKAKYFGGDLPTISEFKKHIWKLNANVLAPCVKEAQYNIWVSTYPTCYVPQSSELFRQFYRKFGKLETRGAGPQYITIGPVDRRMIDDASLATALYFGTLK